jgi:DNA-binding HxlR family transcriptional regulator
MAGHKHDGFGCPIETTLEVLGGKWKGMVLHRLIFGTLRFNELRRSLPHVTQRMLTRQLRELERDGVIHRRVYAEVPPRVEYSLSEFGLSLKPILLMMGDWGAAYQDKVRKMKMSAPAPGTSGRLTTVASQRAGTGQVAGGKQVPR